MVLLEAKTTGWAASGRNGGFCSASLTHGIGNGLERFGAEMPLLEKLGEQNLREIGETIARLDIDCDFRPVGEIGFATADWQLDGLDEAAVVSRQLGHDATVLDAAGARAELNSPRLAGGAQDHHGQRAARARAPGLGAARRLPGRWGADLRAHPGHRAVAGRGLVRDDAEDPVRLGAGRPGCARRRRAGRVAAAPDQRVRDPGLGLRADDRAAVRCAGRRRSAGGTAAARPTLATSSTTSGPPATTGCCGAATTRCELQR